MSGDYQEGWFCNTDQIAELNVQIEDGIIFLTEFLSDETIKKHVYDVRKTSKDVIEDIFALYLEHGRLDNS